MFFRRSRELRKSLRAFEGFASEALPSNSSQSRTFASTSTVKSKAMKVAVLGAAGRTGTCLSLLLKQSCLIDELALYDKAEIASLELELSHIDTKCRVSAAASGEEGLRDTLEDAKIVIVTAGQPCDKDPCAYYTSNKETNVILANANILLDYVPSVAKYCPRALLALTTSPINHLIPLVAEIYKKLGVYDHNRVFGITTLNCVRANTLAAEIMGLRAECVAVPVIGGNCSKTCVPVFSQTKPCCELTHEEISKLTYAVGTAEEQVSREYGTNGNSSLAMGFAAARFCNSLCKGLRGERGVVEYAYTRSCVIPEVTYFAGPLELGSCGIQKYLGVPPLTDRECKHLASAMPYLKEAIRFGETLALGPTGTSTEICSPDPDPCAQEISGKMDKANNNIPPACPS